MARFSDLFSPRRRQASRVAVQWMVDVQVRGTDHFIGFFTQDLSVSGFCLQGQTAEVVARVKAFVWFSVFCAGASDRVGIAETPAVVRVSYDGRCVNSHPRLTLMAEREQGAVK